MELSAELWKYVHFFVAGLGTAMTLVSRHAPGPCQRIHTAVLHPVSGVVSKLASQGLAAFKQEASSCWKEAFLSELPRAILNLNAAQELWRGRLAGRLQAILCVPEPCPAFTSSVKSVKICLRDISGAGTIEIRMRDEREPHIWVLNVEGRDGRVVRYESHWPVVRDGRVNTRTYHRLAEGRGDSCLEALQELLLFLRKEQGSAMLRVKAHRTSRYGMGIWAWVEIWDIPVDVIL